MAPALSSHHDGKYSSKTEPRFETSAHGSDHAWRSALSSEEDVIVTSRARRGIAERTRCHRRDVRLSGLQLSLAGP